MKKSIRSSQFYTYDQYFFYDENAPYIEKENKQAKKWIIAIETETTFTQKFRPALFLKYLDFEHLQINQHSNMYICTKAKYIDVEVNAKWQRRKKKQKEQCTKCSQVRMTASHQLHLHAFLYKRSTRVIIFSHDMEKNPNE